MASEGFNGDEAIIFRGPQRLVGFGPWHMTLARCSPVIFRNVKSLIDMALDCLDRRHRVLFFDIGMERIIHGLHMRMMATSSR